MTTNENAVEVIGLGASLDDIEDLPSFTTFPTGAYHVKLVEGFERKEIADKAAVEVAMTLVDVLEIAPDALEEDEEAPKAGDIATCAYMLGNKFGVGSYKENWLKPLSKFLGTSIVGEIEAGSKGLELGVVVKRVAGKGDNADKKYMRIQKVSVM